MVNSCICVKARLSLTTALPVLEVSSHLLTVSSNGRPNAPEDDWILSKITDISHDIFAF